MRSRAVQFIKLIFPRVEHFEIAQPYRLLSPSWKGNQGFTQANVWKV